MDVQYITNEQGKQVGVLLEMAEYRRLLAAQAADPELLPGLSREELEALARSKLGPEAQAQLDELLQRQKLETLSAEESATLDRLLAQIDQLTILKTQAQYTLHVQSQHNGG